MLASQTVTTTTPTVSGNINVNEVSLLFVGRVTVSSSKCTWQLGTPTDALQAYCKSVDSSSTMAMILMLCDLSDSSPALGSL
jgi:hypothetical protein